LLPVLFIWAARDCSDIPARDISVESPANEMGIKVLDGVKEGYLSYFAFYYFLFLEIDAETDLNPTSRWPGVGSDGDVVASPGFCG
jgi:hypothetical protein